LIHSSSHSDTRWPQSLIDVLEGQRALVDELSKLASDQAALIADGRTEQLMELLGRRQGVIDKFTASQSHIGDLTRDLDARLQSVNVQQRELIKSLIDGIGERLAEVMKRDEHDQASLRSGRDQVQRDLAALGAGRAARNAYLNSPATRSRFADGRG
jgi:SMC interacting uncharacterized protein involved in chromosome segregation